MAFRIHDSVVKGEIDNTQRGRVTGKIWLAGRDNPIILNLAGNCWQDLAGCRCSFVNPAPMEGIDCPLAEDQTGEVGDMTASRKVRIPDLPIEEWHMRRKKGLDGPQHWANSLYLEWYSELNGRVVIESAGYQVEVSMPEWEMTDKAQEEQHEQSAQAMVRFVNRLETALQSAESNDTSADGRDMDEYEWEKFLKECDARTERYGELLDKYHDHPDCERIVSERMGWHNPAESFDLESDIDIEQGDDDIFDDQWEEPPSPDPELEGIDWVRTKSGSIRHPLQQRCFDLSIKVSDDAKNLGLLDSETPDMTVAEMKFCIQRTAVKLAGALNPFARGVAPPPPGFIIAYLKRALKFANDALGAIEQVEKEGKAGDLAAGYKAEMFAIRNDMIALMNRFRNR